MPDSVEELIATFLTDNKHLTDKPYVIWGHCSGALIGMEIAVADISNGHRPAGFIISGCEAPEHALQRLQFRDEDFSEVPDEGILGDLIHFNLMPEDMARDPIFQKYFYRYIGLICRCSANILAEQIKGLIFRLLY